MSCQQGQLGKLPPASTCNWSAQRLHICSEPALGHSGWTITCQYFSLELVSALCGWQRLAVTYRFLAVAKFYRFAFSVPFITVGADPLYFLLYSPYQIVSCVSMTPLSVSSSFLCIITSKISPNPALFRSPPLLALSGLKLRFSIQMINT